MNGLIVTGIEPVSKTTPNGEPNGWAYMSDAMHINMIDTNAWREKYGNYSDEKIVGTGVYDKRVTASADIIVAVKVTDA